MQKFIFIVVLLCCASLANAQTKESKNQGSGSIKTENFKNYRQYTGKKSPFAQFHSNWSRLSHREKAKIMRKFLGSEPLAWINPDGNLPAPHYLALGMNPMNRELVEDFLIFQNEKSYRTSLAQLLPAIVNYQQLVARYSEYPQSLRDHIKEHESFMRRPHSEADVKKVIDVRIKGYKEQLYKYQQKYKSVKRAYLSFGLMPESGVSIGETGKSDGFLPDWKKPLTDKK